MPIARPGGNRRNCRGPIQFHVLLAGTNLEGKEYGVIRFCVMCAKEIEQKRLKSAKVKFCSDECRSADRHERSAIKRAKRRAQGRCEGCGRNLPHERQEADFARVHKLSERVAQ
jgi:RNA polymerase-binding transcription factor DksA